MDELTDKIWFVYIKDHHEGPFSLAEMEQKINAQIVTPQTYVWCEGMGDWQIMANVEKLNKALSTVKPNPSFNNPVLNTPTAEPTTESAPVVQNQTLTPIKIESESLREKTKEMAVSLQEIETTALSLLKNGKIIEETDQSNPPQAEVQAVESLESRSTETSQVLKPGPISEEPVVEDRGSVEGSESIEKAAESSVIIEKSRLIKNKVKVGAKYFFALLFAMGIFLIYYFGTSPDNSTENNRSSLAKITDHLPFMRRWISPVSNLPDVTPDELAVLKNAAQDKPELNGGIQFAIALSQTNLVSPEFYISTNFQGDLHLFLYIVGVPDTLLNQVSFIQKVQIDLAKNIIKTKPLRMADGQPIPKGEYLLYLTPSVDDDPHFKGIPVNFRVPPALPKNIKILLTKSYFLGGEKDVTYASRLKEFHDRLRTQVTNELNEAKQFAATLESQLGSTTEKFTLLQNGKMTPNKRKTWDEFHTKWVALQNQLNEIFQKWTPDVIEKTYFYGILNQLAQQTGLAVSKVHEFQNTYFTGSQDPKTLEIQLGEATSLAQGMIHAYKAKVEQAEKLPTSSNGMPQRDGL